MRLITTIVFGLFMFLFFRSSCYSADSAGAGSGQSATGKADTIEIVCEPEIKDLITSWTLEYNRINPAIMFDIKSSTENGATRSNTIIIESQKNSSSIPEEPGFKIVLAHSAVVPVFNASNPMAEIIVAQGISTVNALKILNRGIKWSEIFENGDDIPVQVYFGDEQTAGFVSDFCKADISGFSYISSPDREEFISAIEKNAFSVGFCRLSDIINPGTGHLPENIGLIPIDRNSNGRIDSFEMIYGSNGELLRGISIGKYPHSLCFNLVALMKEKPKDNNTVAFLNWLASDGGRYITASGFASTVGIEKESNLAELTAAGKVITEVPESGKTGIWLFLSLLILLTGVTGYFVFIFPSTKTGTEEAIGETSFHILNENSLVVPKGIYFDKSHTWSFMEKDGTVRIGVDDFLQHVTGTLTRVRLKEPGEKVRRGEKIITLTNNGKQLEIYSPVSGLILEKNQLLSEDSASVNRSPFNDGWMYLIEPVNWEKEIKFMLMSEKYREWIKEEFIRLKDFFAGIINLNRSAYAQVILQDGGELTDNALADLSPDVWEDFQVQFLDPSR